MISHGKFTLLIILYLINVLFLVIFLHQLIMKPHKINWCSVFPLQVFVKEMSRKGTSPWPGYFYITKWRSCGFLDQSFCVMVDGKHCSATIRHAKCELLIDGFSVLHAMVFVTFYRHCFQNIEIGQMHLCIPTQEHHKSLLVLYYISSESCIL